MLNGTIMNTVNETKRKAFQKLYADEEILPWTTKEALDESLPLIIDFIKKNNIHIGSLLDYGAGTCHFAIALKQMLGIPKVVAVDFTENCANKEELAHSGVEFVVADRPEKVGGKYDAILCWTVLHSINPELHKEYLAQFAKMLNDNGVLLLSAFSSEDKAFAGKASMTSAYSGLPLYAGVLESDQICKDAGFETVETGSAIQPLGESDRMRKMGISYRSLQCRFLRKAG